MNRSLDFYVLVSPDVLFQVLEGEAVLLDLKSGKYYGLDAVGTRLWSLLVEYGHPQPIIERMQSEFDVAEERLHSEVLGWIDRLCEHGLVRVEPEV